MRGRALQRELGLTSQQRDAVQGILERQLPERRRLMSDMLQHCGDPLRVHKAKVDAEIRAVLNPEQQRRFDALAARQGERLFPRMQHGRRQ
jgi:protein CpxP